MEVNRFCGSAEGILLMPLTSRGSFRIPATGPKRRKNRVIPGDSCIAPAQVSVYQHSGG